MSGTARSARGDGRAGRAWFLLVATVWVVLVLLAIASPDTLSRIWDGIRGLPPALELIVWLVTLPWVVALAVWESDIGTAARSLIVLVIAASWILVSIPRRPVRRIVVHEELRPQHVLRSDDRRDGPRSPR